LFFVERIDLQAEISNTKNESKLIRQNILAIDLEERKTFVWLA